jgi:hypothetical protein
MPAVVVLQPGRGRMLAAAAQVRPALERSAFTPRHCVVTGDAGRTGTMNRFQVCEAGAAVAALMEVLTSRPGKDRASRCQSR